jgi:hypothetical protein
MPPKFERTSWRRATLIGRRLQPVAQARFGTTSRRFDLLDRCRRSGLTPADKEEILETFFRHYSSVRFERGVFFVWRPQWECGEILSGIFSAIFNDLRRREPIIK